MTQPPTPPAADQPAPARPPRRSPVRRSRTGPVVMILLAVGGFAALAVFLATRVPPYVTHKEALELVLTIEATKGQPALQKLVAGPEVAQVEIAEAIDAAKQAGNYTYLTTRNEQSERLALVFRSDKNDVLFDYHELRVARIDGTVRIVGLWSMARDGWLRELAEERDRLAKDPAYVAYRQAAEKATPLTLLTAFHELPDALRRSSATGEPLLQAIAKAEPVTALDLVEAHRRQHPGSLAGDVAWVRRVQSEFKSGVRKPMDRRPPPRAGQVQEPARPEEVQMEKEHRAASGALDRIVQHTTDENFAEPWQRLLDR